MIVEQRSHNREDNHFDEPWKLYIYDRRTKKP